MLESHLFPYYNSMDLEITKKIEHSYNKFNEVIPAFSKTLSESLEQDQSENDLLTNLKKFNSDFKYDFLLRVLDLNVSEKEATVELFDTQQFSFLENLKMVLEDKSSVNNLFTQLNLRNIYYIHNVSSKYN